MILPGLSEERILEELLLDYKIVVNEAKKAAKKKILSLQKMGRDGINEEIFLLYHITTNKQKNKWSLVVTINMARNPKWYQQCVCCVESDYYTKDYYIVRGFSNKQPYFIKISSHTLRRVKERFFQERLKFAKSVESEYLPTIVLCKGEIIPWMKVTDPRLLKNVLQAEDKHTITTLFYTRYGCYLGYETEKGNVEFRTFLNNDSELKNAEENIAVYMCKLAHIFFNRKLYTKEYFEAAVHDKTPIPDIIAEIMLEYKDKYKLLP